MRIGHICVVRLLIGAALLTTAAAAFAIRGHAVDLVNDAEEKEKGRSNERELRTSRLRRQTSSLEA
jgi:hypothetical protein